MSGGTPSRWENDQFWILFGHFWPKTIKNVKKIEKKFRENFHFLGHFWPKTAIFGSKTAKNHQKCEKNRKKNFAKIFTFLAIFGPKRPKTGHSWPF